MNTDQAMTTISDSGTIELKDGMIVYSSQRGGSWSLPVSSIRVIGEYTNEDGPHLDDYFFVFLTDSTTEWWQAPIYAEGRDAFIPNLQKVLPGFGAMGLSNSTSFKSRVLWPSKHYGKELFTFSKPQVSGFVSRLIAKLDSRVEQSLARSFD